jgi:16S rRNA (cytosine1402-N4)-methyltransferase
MLKETIDLLDVKSDGIYVDGTLGRGGHSLEILKQLDSGHLYAFDLDMEAINETKERLKEYNDKITYIHSNYSDIKNVLNELGVTKVDGIILDLGVSSPQFDDSDRGFSYRYDARLDMRMDQEQAISAYEVINDYDYHALVKIFFQYGEEKFSKQIARKIEKAREDKPIETTFELVDIIKKSLPTKVLNKKGHPAKKVFQAIRIEVNHELDSLKKLLTDFTDLLDINGTCCIITFHSLEDRIVKNYFKDLATVEKIDKRIPIDPKDLKVADFDLLNKKIIIATDTELVENKRSTSAKLRGIRRIKYNGDN